MGMPHSTGVDATTGSSLGNPGCLAARRRSAAARRPAAGGEAPAALAAASTVVERRACDVLVIGDSAAALAASAALSRSRKTQVALIPGYGVAAQRPPAPSLEPLKLTDTEADLTRLLVEAAAYWRGVEAAADTQLLLPCATLDFAGDAGADHPGAVALEALRAAAREAGVDVAYVRADEAATRTGGQVTLPTNAAGLWQPHGSVLLARKGVDALTALALRRGVAAQDRLLLRSWRDNGSRFTVAASTAAQPDLLWHYEAERVLLAPGVWPAECLRLFGLAAAMHSVQLLGARWPAGSDVGVPLPLWNYLGSDGSSGDGPPGQQAPAWGTRSGGTMHVGQLPWQGRRVEDPFAWRRGREAPADPADPPDAEGEPSAELLALHAPLSRFVRGAAGARAGRLRTHVAAVAADGRPALGWHPGFERGRVLVCCGLAGSTQHVAGFSSGSQLGPVLGKMAADALLGGSAAEPGAGGALGLDRPALEADAGPLEGLDSWEGLAALQQAPVVGREERQREEEAAEERRRAQQ